MTILGRFLCIRGGTHIYRLRPTLLKRNDEGYDARMDGMLSLDFLHHGREFQFLGAGGRAEDHTVLGESWSILLTQPFLYFPHLLLVLISYSCFPFPSCFQASHTLVLEVWVKVV